VSAETGFDLSIVSDYIVSAVKSSHAFRVAGRFFRQTLKGYTAYSARGQYDVNVASLG